MKSGGEMDVRLVAQGLASGLPVEKLGFDAVAASAIHKAEDAKFTADERAAYQRMTGGGRGFQMSGVMRASSAREMYSTDVAARRIAITIAALDAMGRRDDAAALLDYVLTDVYANDSTRGKFSGE